MPVTTLVSDPSALTLTVSGEYPVPVERLWDAWTDPRQIERFWGPPGWPATFVRHDLVVGGRSEYFMTGPDGERSAGYWIVQEMVEGRRIKIVDGFAREDGSVDDQMPTMRMDITFSATSEGSRFTMVTTFPDLATMEQLVSMGMVDGLSAALAQMDDLVAEGTSFAAGPSADAQILDDTRVRISRVIRGALEPVWRAHHEPELMQKWLLGPDGWTMPICEVATEVGQRYRYEWASDDGTTRFGFEGELLESQPPRRSVTTEQRIGTHGPATLNDMTLRPVDGGTLLCIVITYPSTELRDEILATGMVDGLEASYARMEKTIPLAV